MEATLSLPSPAPDELAHVERMRGHLRALLTAAGGSLPFSVFMHEALYAPGLGYDAAGARKFGAAGDFVTAPETSPVFGGCLARQVAEVFGTLRQHMPAAPLTLVEYGAGSGALAVQLLEALAALDALPAAYAIVEVSSDLRERQAALFASRLTPELARRVVWWSGHAPAPWRGVLIANEVLDALPVERLRVGEQGLEQCFLTTRADSATDELAFRWQAATPAMAAAGAQLQAEALASISQGSPKPWAVGTRFEVCPAVASWVGEALAQCAAGVALYIDYGLPRAQLLGPSRPAGTFSVFFRHRQHEDALLYPGLQDLTAWVDFTAVAAAGVAAGAHVAGYLTQAQFLVNAGLDAVFAEALAALESLEGAARLREQARLSQGVQRLVMPQEMGERFHVLALAKGYDDALSGFARRDLTHTL